MVLAAVVALAVVGVIVLAVARPWGSGDTARIDSLDEFRSTVVAAGVHCPTTQYYVTDSGRASCGSLEMSLFTSDAAREERAEYLRREFLDKSAGQDLLLGSNWLVQGSRADVARVESALGGTLERGTAQVVTSGYPLPLPSPGEQPPVVAGEDLPDGCNVLGEIDAWSVEAGCTAPSPTMSSLDLTGLVRDACAAQSWASANLVVADVTLTYSVDRQLPGDTSVTEMIEVDPLSSDESGAGAIVSRSLVADDQETYVRVDCVSGMGGTVDSRTFTRVELNPQHGSGPLPEDNDYDQPMAGATREHTAICASRKKYNQLSRDIDAVHEGRASLASMRSKYKAAPLIWDAFKDTLAARAEGFEGDALVAACLNQSGSFNTTD